MKNEPDYVYFWPAEPGWQQEQKVELIEKTNPA
jgi:hypothetical protein